ncbi:MAG: hypothetical protein NTW25_01705, partial [Candidatus Kapabacteria bacterium]|nr:hypothetical protein [Candidatus Kapabacteria bacterium]
SGTVSTNWLATAGFGNTMTNGTGNVSTLAGLNDAFAKGSTFNPAPKANATFLTTANFTDLSDPFFDKVAYRGAMDATNRWDSGWVEYDPINKEYKVATSKTSFIKPVANDKYRVGRSTILQWDTTSQATNGKTLKFSWSLSASSTSWSALPMPKGKLEFVDGTALKATGTVNTTMPNIATASLYIKLEDKNDPTFNAIVGPITVTIPTAGVVDSTLKGDITGIITLSSTKIYGLDGVVYVQSGGVLRIEPGTVIKGDNTKTSAICVNRGGIIYANGTAQKPIVMTSGQPVGQRERGDWGGLLIMGKAKSNLVEAPIEGGIADDATVKKNAWFGGTDDADSSGVLRYVRVEFGGIAESPDNELNGITFGAVGNRTVVDYVQSSYSGDDSFEWFGGTVNCKHIIAYNGIDDDFDTDNGYRGKLQFGIGRRFNDIADISNSEAFESDNDASASENQPFTNPIFSNFTAIGGVMDTSYTAWSAGADYSTRYHPKFLTAAQIRRNSRMALYNSVLIGWPAGVELTNNNTVRAANADSVRVKYNDFYGIKANKYFYAGGSTTFSGTVSTNWLATAGF